MTVKGYAKFLLIMAGLGGLLYGVDVGVIAAALPYIERTSGTRFVRAATVQLRFLRPGADDAGKN